ncbi:MAG TPA: hypothetical protein VNC61_06665 [Acidimicrobiales bacterium]|nr:hypothetical protein [Acidimicrobiales bacterium]
MKREWRRQLRTLSCALGAASVVLATVVATVAVDPGVASAARRPLCVGTADNPGVLAGSFRSGVRIEGVCTVNGGPTVVRGALTILPDSTLVAAFALNDLTGKGSSRLTVLGGISVRPGATLILGCDPGSFSCIDDPNPDAPTLSAAETVRGVIRESSPLGVIIHDATINGNVRQTGGGGDGSCAVPTTGVFSLFQSPVYSAYEDMTIHGNLTITNVKTCWMGVDRVVDSGSVTLTKNQTADPDAIEILSNTISGDLKCASNTSVWDSAEAAFGQTGLYPRTPGPNTVNGSRLGQCVLASPATEGGPPGPGPF